MQVDVTLWGSRMWSCASHTATDQDCRRRVELTGPSDFSTDMMAFLQAEDPVTGMKRAQLFVRCVSSVAASLVSIWHMFFSPTTTTELRPWNTPYWFDDVVHDVCVTPEGESLTVRNFLLSHTVNQQTLRAHDGLWNNE